MIDKQTWKLIDLLVEKEKLRGEINLAVERHRNKELNMRGRFLTDRELQLMHNGLLDHGTRAT
jgi:hypothetical protein